MSEIELLDETTLQPHIQKYDGFILFFKEHCPNCKVMRKVLDKCHEKNPKLKIAGIDIEIESSLLEKYKIAKVPTILITRSGTIVASHTGLSKPSEMLALYFES